MAASSDVVEPQPRVVDLGASFAPAARARIDAYLKSFVSFEPVLGLLYSDAGELPSWSLIAFAKVTADELVKMYSAFGAVVCYDIDGLSVIVPQIAHIEQLDSGTLDFAGDRLQQLPSAAS